jgi:hypothetical protein
MFTAVDEQIQEDASEAKLSGAARVDLAKLFNGMEIRTLREMSLTGAASRSEIDLGKRRWEAGDPFFNVPKEVIDSDKEYVVPKGGCFCLTARVPVDPSAPSACPRGTDLLGKPSIHDGSFVSSACLSVLPVCLSCLSCLSVCHCVGGTALVLRGTGEHWWLHTLTALSGSHQRQALHIMGRTLAAGTRTRSRRRRRPSPAPRCPTTVPA